MEKELELELELERRLNKCMFVIGSQTKECLIDP